MDTHTDRLIISAIIIWNDYFKFVIIITIVHEGQFINCFLFQGKMEEEDMRTTVELYIYDLTKGMAAIMSSMLIGKHEESMI